MVVTGCQENKSCRKILNFLERLDDRIRCTHEETVAVVKPWKDLGSKENESKVPGRIREGDVVRAKNNRIREGNGRRFQGRRKGKEKSFCSVVVQFELNFRHPCFYVVCACIEFFGEIGHFTERSGFLGALCHLQKADGLQSG